MATTDSLTSTLAVAERHLLTAPGSVPLMFLRACTLDEMGSAAPAEAAYREVLKHDPDHRLALNQLGNLLFGQFRFAEARVFYKRALTIDPEDPMCLVNYGNLLLRTNDPLAARDCFNQALKADPADKRAHAGLSFALSDLGDAEQAENHRNSAFQNRAIVDKRYRGTQPAITVLEVVSSIGGNMRTDLMVDDRIFHRFLLAAEFYNASTVLPKHDLLLNAVGDADLVPDALNAAEALIARSKAPVVNSPAAVRQTTRCGIAERLRGIPYVTTANTLLLSRRTLSLPDAPAILAKKGFTFPLLLRSQGFHGGAHFEKVDSATELPRVVADLPGDSLLVLQYLDASGRDKKFRKYRVMMVDGQLYPLHLAVSPNWKIHFVTADMEDNAAHRDEDAAFLKDMKTVLGPRAMTAVGKIQSMLGLDYAGIDFGMTQNGKILVFEANATMAVPPPPADPRWDYRRPAVKAIHDAVTAMLRKRAGSTTRGAVTA